MAFQHLLQRGGLPAHVGLGHDTKLLSPDYYTVYVPLSELASSGEGEEIKMNQKVELSTDMTFKTPKARALVSLNPRLKDYFKDINGDVVLEPGETYIVVAKAKKNLTSTELLEAFGAGGNWLYRVSILV